MKLAQSKVHFIGIGGIGMCGLAELLYNMGAEVTGSDLSENAQTKRLRDLGINIWIGHAEENVDSAEVVVYSSAVKPGNPEFLGARKRKIPLIPRAEALAEMMRLKRGIAVGGTHGKTTTTSLTASIFLHAQAKPTIVVGGRLDKIKSTALLGEGEWMIAEADESDGSFSKLSPEVVIVTNIDNDHLDYFGTEENLKMAFFDFAGRIPFYGLAIACGDDPKVRQVFGDFPKRLLLYGFDDSNDIVLKGSDGEYEVSLNGERIGAFTLQLPGKHNALNALAAIAAGMEAGLDFETCAQGVAGFAGVDRRFQFKGKVNGAEVYDDYGHHPTEVLAVLQAFREKFPKRRVVVAFQPHRYSRTVSCWSQFLECFHEADKLFILDIYAAGEAPVAGISGERLAREVKHADSEYLPGTAEAVRRLREELKPGDIFVTLGAGDCWKIGMELLDGQKKEVAT